MSSIKKIIIWGHSLHTHTHSYIHNGFYIAFKHCGYDTYWFDDNTNVSDFDFSNSLFISEHQVDNNIPKRADCLYFIHFLDSYKYINIPRQNVIDLKCAFRDMKREKEINTSLNFIPINDKNFEFYCINNVNELTYYMMWATDIFPETIQENINNLENISNKRNTNVFNFIGSLNKEWNEAYHSCSRKNIKFNKYGATFNKNNHNNKSIDENIELMQTSIISPAFQDVEVQIRDNYVPCRIFKNISYGRMGITNNKFVNELFNNKLICHENIHKCIDMGIEFENKNNKLEIIKELMEVVRDNHTYIQRIDAMKQFINTTTNFII